MLKLKKIPVKKNEFDMPMMDSYPPTIHLTSKQVSEVKEWEVGETYQVVFDIKQTSKSENKDKTINASFEIVGYKAIDDVDDEDLEELQAEGLSS